MVARGTTCLTEAPGCTQHVTLSQIIATWYGITASNSLACRLETSIAWVANKQAITAADGDCSCWRWLEVNGRIPGGSTKAEQIDIECRQQAAHAFLPYTLEVLQGRITAAL